MQTTKMTNYSNLIQLKAFREKYALTQDEMAVLLDITRSQWAMSERLQRSLTSKGEENFLALQNTFSEKNFQPKSPAEYDNSVQQRFMKDCEYQLTEMQYEIITLESELPGRQKQREKLIYAVQFWEFVLRSGVNVNFDRVSIIVERCFLKLRKVDLFTQLQKEIKIKILSAGVDVLKQFIADNHPA